MISSRLQSESVCSTIIFYVVLIVLSRYTKALDSIKSLRKDRVDDLKAEKERLESLALQKANADKLKARISDLNAVISGKEVEYEERKQEYEALVISNQKFYEYASKFRELYMKIESLQEKKTRYEEELAQARENFQEVVGKSWLTCL